MAMLKDGLHRVYSASMSCKNCIFAPSSSEKAFAAFMMPSSPESSKGGPLDCHFRSYSDLGTDIFTSVDINLDYTYALVVEPPVTAVDTYMQA